MHTLGMTKTQEAKGLIQTGVQVKTGRKIARRDLPFDWSIANVRNYGMSVSMTNPDSEIWCWHEGQCVAIYKDQKLVGGR